MNPEHSSQHAPDWLVQSPDDVAKGTPETPPGSSAVGGEAGPKRKRKNRKSSAAGPTERSEASTVGSAAESQVLQSGVGGRCNTQPQTSQLVVVEGYPEAHVAGGFDWLEWAASVEWNTFLGSAMMWELDWMKKECQEEKQSDKWIELIGLAPIRVFRTGMNRGGERGQHFEYKISYRGFVIGLANVLDADPERQNLFVCLGGRECLLNDAQMALDAVREFVGKLGAKIIVEKLTRADFCLDLAGVPIDAFQRPVEQRQFITRAKSLRPHSELVSETKSGFEAGLNPLHLTVYDKLLEQRHKTDGLYLQALIERRWGGKLPEHASRVEFQASRKWFIENGISSPDDLFRMAGSVVDKLTAAWFRLTSEPVDREDNHQSRAVTLPLWKSVQQGFRVVFGEPRGQLVPIDRSGIVAKQLIKQARGCLAAAMLQHGLRPFSYDDFGEKAKKLLLEIGGSDDEQLKFIEEFWCRESEHAYEPYKEAA